MSNFGAAKEKDEEEESELFVGDCVRHMAALLQCPPLFFKRCQGVAKLIMDIETTLRNCRQHGRSEETFGGASCPSCGIKPFFKN